MSEPTREKCLEFLDSQIERGLSIRDFDWVAYFQAIRKLIVKPTYELDDGTVCCRHCGTVLGYKEDFEGSTNVQMEQPGVTDLDIAHWMDRCHELEEHWLDTWIGGCSENMDECSGCMIEEKECQKAYDTIRKHLKENQIMRELLWANHGCPQSAMYGDDGEMQCNACMFDFKRGDMEAFAERRAKKNTKRYQEYLKMKGGSDE